MFTTFQDLYVDADPVFKALFSQTIHFQTAL